MSSTPFSLRIFVADGDPDGLRLVERSNWIGKAVMFPRALYTKVRGRDEFKQTGVYLLLGPRTDGEGEMLYIGEGDPVGPRLESHYANKEFWTQAVFFVAGSGQLNKAHVQYLEAKLVARALEAKRVKLDNGNKPTEPTLSEADRADMDVFLGNILGMLPVLGIHAFEKGAAAVIGAAQTVMLYCKGRGGNAKGMDTPQGFVVLKGSFAASDEVPSFKVHWVSYSKQREELIKNEVLTPDSGVFVFSQHYTFSSPSLASAMVTGSSPNGRIDWKDASGKTLKQIQESETQTSGSITAQ